jgi:serine protease
MRMRKHLRFPAALGILSAFAMAGCASNGNVTPSAPSFDSAWIQKDGILYHAPHYMVTRKHARPQVQRAILLSYGGGPVQVTPTVFLIFWGYTKYGDSHSVKPLLESYIGNLGGSSHNNIYTQYYEVSGGKTIYITNPSNQYSGAWEDDSDAVPRHPTDSQIAAEALRGVKHFGYNASASYVVATPHGRSTSGFGTQWCAYHSATTSSGRLVSYTDLPYMPDAGASCGSNIISPPSDETGADEGVTIVEGHEQGESVTDPDPPSGWYNNQYGEIGDICAWQNIQNDPFGSFSYTMQPMFSNATQSCVQSY